MNVFLHELKSHRKVTLIWILSLFALAAFYFSILPSFMENAKEIDRLFSAFPPSVLRAFGMGTGSVASLNGFYPMIIGFVLLLGAIQALHLSLSVFSKETSGKVADFIFTKPITRTRLLWAKLLAVLTILLITNAAYLVFSVLIAKVVPVGEYDQTAYVMTTLSLPLVQLLFAALGTAVSAFVQKIKSVAAAALSIVFSFYIINAISSAVKSEALRYVSPFSYFSPQYILANHAYEGSFLLLTFALTALFTAAAWVKYCGRDIHSA